MIAFAVVFGLIAVFVAQSWLNNQAEMRMRNLEANKKPLVTNTIVVASQPLQFGVELNASMLREVPWPQDAVPAGAFSRISELVGSGKRVVLSPMEANEPVLALKVTGPGQRATLSALVGDGMKAVTIRVNDVEGVGGFVLPGDRVDVLLTRTEGTANDKKEMFTDVLLQHVRVLGIDQLADDRSEKPVVVKAVTLEVGTEEGQKLALAGTVGTLSLALRPAGATTTDLTQRVTSDDLGTALQVGAAGPQMERAGKVFVTRGVTRTEYTVPVEHRVAKAVHRKLATNQ
jgi:pilus assembly protein CpaB